MITIDYIQSFCSNIGIENTIEDEVCFSELGIDSLTVIELIHNIEMDYNIVIPWSSYDATMTIGDFIRNVNNL
ncbi:MAG: acyl carrier protein [Prevotella sp.]|nr:acyl carrier protein [Prevotella sp.]